MFSSLPAFSADLDMLYKARSYMYLIYIDSLSTEDRIALHNASYEVGIKIGENHQGNVTEIEAQSNAEIESLIEKRDQMLEKISESTTEAERKDFLDINKKISDLSFKFLVQVSK